MEKLTKTEQDILIVIREARPYEIIEITKDQLGRPDYYLVKRTQKIIIRDSQDDKK